MARTVTQREDDGFWSVSGLPEGTYYDHPTALQVAAELDREALAQQPAEAALDVVQSATLKMILWQLQDGALLIPNTDVSLKVPAAPPGIHRRAVFTLPVATSALHTITLDPTDAVNGSRIMLVIPAEGMAAGWSYDMVNGGPAGGVVEALDANLVAFLASGIAATGGAFAARVFSFDGTNWLPPDGYFFGGARMSVFFDREIGGDPGLTDGV
jgi:hypothetical protein